MGDMSQEVSKKRKNQFQTIEATKPTTAPDAVSQAVAAPPMTADWVAAMAEPTTGADIHPADYANANAPPAFGPMAVTPITTPTPVIVSPPITAPAAV